MAVFTARLGRAVRAVWEGLGSFPNWQSACKGAALSAQLPLSIKCWVSATFNCILRPASGQQLCISLPVFQALSSRRLHSKHRLMGCSTALADRAGGSGPDTLASSSAGTFIYNPRRSTSAIRAEHSILQLPCGRKPQAGKVQHSPGPGGILANTHTCLHHHQLTPSITTQDAFTLAMEC